MASTRFRPTEDELMFLQMVLRALNKATTGDPDQGTADLNEALRFCIMTTHNMYQHWWSKNKEEGGKVDECDSQEGGVQARTIHPKCDGDGVCGSCGDGCGGDGCVCESGPIDSGS